MWHSRIADGGAREEGAQKFEGTLNRSWFHADRRILLEGELTDVGEDGRERRIPGYLALDKADASTIRYRFVKGGITFAPPTGDRCEPAKLERFVTLSAKPVARYKLTTKQGDFDKAPQFIPSGEIDPAAQGFRRFAFRRADGEPDKAYSFVVTFDERGYPASTEAMDKSGKVILTPVTVGADLAVFAVAVPFVVCIGLPYALLDSCGHPFPPDHIPMEPAGVWISPDGQIQCHLPKPFVDADTQTLLDATEPQGSPYVSGSQAK